MIRAKRRVCKCARVWLYTQVDECKRVPVGLCVCPCVSVPVCAYECGECAAECACLSSGADRPRLTLSDCPLCPPQRAQHKEHITGVTWLRLEAAELDPGSMYEARLRVQMATQDGAMEEEESYEGQWSEWSQPVSCPSPQRPGGRCVAAAVQSLGWAFLPAHPFPFLGPLLPAVMPS